MPDKVDDEIELVAAEIEAHLLRYRICPPAQFARWSERQQRRTAEQNMPPDRYARLIHLWGRLRKLSNTPRAKKRGGRQEGESAVLQLLGSHHAGTHQRRTQCARDEI